MADKKVSELDPITGADTAADDLFLIVDASGSVTKKITRAELNNAIEQDVLSTVDINGGTIDNTVIGGTTPAAGDFTTLGATGLTVDSDSATATIKAFQPKFILDDDSAAGAGSDKLIIQSAAGQSDGDYEFVLNNDQTSSADRTAMKIKGNGDISFYADNGTTQGLFWDASTQRLGLGDTTPSQTLDINGNARVDGSIYLADRIYHDGDTNTSIRFPAADTISLNTAGQERVYITSGGSVGIGTSSPSNQLHLYGTSPIIRLEDSGAGGRYARINADGSIGALVLESDSSGVGGSIMNFKVGGTERMRIDSSGRVGIGTSSPTADLHISYGSGSGLLIEDTTNSPSVKSVITSGNTESYFGATSNHPVVFLQNNTERMRIDSSGNVGIGVANPTGKLNIAASNGDGFEFLPSNTTDTNWLQSFDRVNGSWVNQVSAALSHQLYTNGSERMRLDASGNLLVGKTSEDATTVGSTMRPNGGIVSVRDGDTNVVLNRKTSDGTIIDFRKDGTTVGSIGAVAGKIYIGSSAGGDTFLRLNSNTVTPANSSGADRDDAINLGYSSGRFNDIFATNGTIQTSDANEKQQIAALTDAEMTAAKAISQLFKTFKWNDSVAEKSDAARTHTGVIAQEVQAAMSDAGLDAANYAFWCSDTWTNDDGNEQTRMGVRYPQLLAFIGAATEQRLADIETRLTALEAN